MITNWKKNYLKIILQLINWQKFQVNLIKIEPEIRKTWDNSIKTIERTYITNISSIQYCHYSSPIFFISERDVVDKRVDFSYNNIYYNLSTSIENDLEPVKEKITRCTNYLNIYIITEDDHYFYFRGFNQVDTKVVNFDLDDPTRIIF